jgi:pimeloyl-ACP methyl ester carboxylesterase
MREIIGSFLAVIGMLVFGFVLYVVSFVPSLMRVGVITTIAPKCTSPQHVPANVGKLIAADLRQPGDGSAFSTTSREAWVEQTVTRLNSETDSVRDLVVFAHGFRTGFGEATCAGENLRAALAGLPSYAASGGPDVFVFGWPGEFSIVSFGSARENATRAGHYLGGVLRGLKNRRIILVAHSLGAEVVMTAAGDLPDPAPAPQLAGMLLVEGAIPAVSIRKWRSTFTETYPRTDMENAAQGKPLGKPYVETEEGEPGRFVAAARRAAHLVVTTAGDDGTLGSAFKLNETFLPSDRKGPIIPGEVGDDTGNNITAQAIGIPFPTGAIHRHHEDLLPDLDIREKSDAKLPKIFPTNAWKVMTADDWDFEFKVEHASYHEIRLGGHWWRVLYDWHGVMNDEVVRHRILTESWAFFSGRAN